jgi:hypothetical protein
MTEQARKDDGRAHRSAETRAMAAPHAVQLFGGARDLRETAANGWRLGAGALAPGNASQVTRVRQIIEGLGQEIATSEDARKILSLKGVADVGF